MNAAETFLRETLVGLDPLEEAAAIELGQTMSDHSERCYFAGWLGGTEETIWLAIVWAKLNRGRDFAAGAWSISAEELERIEDLAARAGGWVRFVLDPDRRGGGGLEYVPLRTWASGRIRELSVETLAREVKARLEEAIARDARELRAAGEARERDGIQRLDLRFLDTDEDGNRE